MRKTRITLVQPPETSDLDFGSFSLAVLATSVRDISDCTLIDITTLSLHEAAQKITRTSPDIVGITTMGWSSVEPAEDLIRELRGWGYNNSIVVGGHGASVLPQPVLNAGADAVVVGEGELTFRDVVLNGISRETPGLALLINGSCYLSPERPLIEPLDSLPLPSYELIEGQARGFFPLETSRGCPHRCAFCETSLFFRNTWRAFSPEMVAQNVRRLIEDYGATLIHIVDDNFTADPFRTLRICRLLQDGPLPLFFFFAARTDDLLRHSDLISALSEARFLRVNVGVETLDMELAMKIGKPISFDTHKRAFDLMREARIYTYASFIIGLPGEREDMHKNYVQMAVELGVDAAHFLPFAPLPGTPLGKGNPQPEPWCVKEAHELTREFERHPVVIDRLLKASRKTDVRGALARETLTMRLKMDVLDERTAQKVRDELMKIEQGP